MKTPEHAPDPCRAIVRSFLLMLAIVAAAIAFGTRACHGASLTLTWDKFVAPAGSWWGEADHYIISYGPATGNTITITNTAWAPASTNVATITGTPGVRYGVFVQAAIHWWTYPEIYTNAPSNVVFDTFQKEPSDPPRYPTNLPPVTTGVKVIGKSPK